MITLRQERPADVEAREALLDEAFGDTRARKTSQRLRDGRLPAEGLSLHRRRRPARGRHRAAVERRPAAAASRRCCSARWRSRRIAATAASAPPWCGAPCAMRAGSAMARSILVGDAPYYGRFGFAGREAAANSSCPARSSAIVCSRSNSSPRALDGASGLRARRAGPPGCQRAQRPRRLSKTARFSWTPRRNSRRRPSVCAPRRISPKDRLETLTK